MKTFPIRIFRYIKILMILFVLFIPKTVSAQYVTIPDPNFVSYLTINFPSAMAGSQMDTTNLSITTATSVFVYGLGISNLDGIQYFDNLEQLTCANNNLSSLPNLPATLTSLNCFQNAITSLPQLPPNLEILFTSSNLLTTLPPLPNSLLSLNCSSNNLGVLPPTLPPGLTQLHCNSCNLSSLPALPATLLQLHAFGNNLTTLPALPSGLTVMLVQSNQLNPSSLNVLPPSLTILWCGYNNLGSFTGTLPAGLIVFECAGNSLPSIPPLPSNLQELVCGSNLLTSLPPLPNTLTRLFCDFNSISSLPTLPNSLVDLGCNSNPITCLPVLPDSLNVLNFDNTNITCLPNYPSYVNIYDVPPTSIPLCDVSSGCPMGYNIYGKIYFDNDQDCSYQIGENLLATIPIDLWQSGSLVAQNFSLGGYYSFDGTLGNYDVIVDTTDLPFEFVCNTPGLDTNIVLTTLDSIAEDINFGFKCKPGYDVSIHSVYRSSGLFFPGQNVGVRFNIGDAVMFYNGLTCNTSGISGTVQITVSGPVTYVSPAPLSLVPIVSGSTFTYNISDFSLVDPYTDFGLLFNTDTIANIGDVVCFAVSVSTSGTENTLVNNNTNHCFTIANSYDPNVKEVNPVGDLSYPYNDWLTYTVHFQNTGNAHAINIKLLDVLDSDLDASTFRLLNSSHDVNVTLTGSNATFLFNGIMLADSTSNEPASHGFVQYKIKPLTNLAPGTVISNTADIYFDFNSPITTNTTMNTIVNLSGVEEQDQLPVNVYPNPATDFIMIQTENISTNAYMQIVDMLGRTIQQIPLTETNHLVSLEGFVNGIYSVKVVDGAKETVKKIIIQK